MVPPSSDPGTNSLPRAIELDDRQRAASTLRARHAMDVMRSAGDGQAWRSPLGTDRALPGESDELDSPFTEIAGRDVRSLPRCIFGYLPTSAELGHTGPPT